MTCPRFSTLVAGSLVLVAVLLAAMAVLLDYSAESHSGKIVVKVRLWADQIAAAYQQSFEAFNRAHPDIEVHTNIVAYSTYFDTLRTTSPAAAPTTSSGCPTRTWPPTPTAAGCWTSARRWARVPLPTGSRQWWTSSPAEACCGVCRS